MPQKATKKQKNNQLVWILASVIVLLVAVCTATIVGLLEQSKIVNQYELISRLDNQACRYLADRGHDSQVSGGFVLNSDASETEAKLTYYCYTGENVQAKTIHGKPIDAYALGARVKYFQSNEAAEDYAKQKLSPLRFWSEDGSNQIQDKNYTFIVTDEKVPYFDAYRVRANAVVRVSLHCKDNNFETCDKQAKQLLDQELKGINVL